MLHEFRCTECETTFYVESPEIILYCPSCGGSEAVPTDREFEGPGVVVPRFTLPEDGHPGWPRLEAAIESAPDDGPREPDPFDPI
jgi:predicted  nucleic acid-binding Zn-ribbon protein